MISEIDINDWVIYPEEALDKVKEGENFMYRGIHCWMKKKGFFSHGVIDANGVEFELDFFTLVNPIKRK
jgi:hypothetical protein